MCLRAHVCVRFRKIGVKKGNLKSGSPLRLKRMHPTQEVCGGAFQLLLQGYCLNVMWDLKQASPTRLSQGQSFGERGESPSHLRAKGRYT